MSDAQKRPTARAHVHTILNYSWLVTHELTSKTRTARTQKKPLLTKGRGHVTTDEVQANTIFRFQAAFESAQWGNRDVSQHVRRTFP